MGSAAGILMLLGTLGLPFTSYGGRNGGEAEVGLVVGEERRSIGSSHDSDLTGQFLIRLQGMFGRQLGPTLGLRVAGSVDREIDFEVPLKWDVEGWVGAQVGRRNHVGVQLGYGLHDNHKWFLDTTTPLLREFSRYYGWYAGFDVALAPPRRGPMFFARGQYYPSLSGAKSAHDTKGTGFAFESAVGYELGGGRVFAGYRRESFHTHLGSFAFDTDYDMLYLGVGGAM
ncbi:MAG: hypothetical protein HYU66_22965 [Armatimonadetes bacterium]|nr:hypothetical protein [Armatimonadota bacterium]